MDSQWRTTLFIIVAVLLIAGAGVAAWWFGARQPSESAPPEQPGTENPRQEESEKPAQETVAENLTVPWALGFLPNGSLIFTERVGNIKLIEKSGAPPALLGSIDKVAAEGEGGLLGLAVHPDYAKNRFIYLYYTYQAQGRLLNRVVRYKLQGSKLTQDKIIVDKIPGSSNHNGGRIKFGPDGLLYVTTGDSEEPDLAQNLKSLAGKILRFEDDGGVPAKNPFPDLPVYSLGHRNPQGLAWDNRRRLWATEHGQSGNDEVNLIEAGNNYGWPTIEGDEGRSGPEKPVVHSNGDTWAPSGAAFHDGSLVFAGLRGQALFTLKTEAPGAPRHLLEGELGRLRDVVVGPDARLYISTSNNDGRGIPGRSDDRIIATDLSRL